VQAQKSMMSVWLVPTVQSDEEEWICGGRVP